VNIRHGDVGLIGRAALPAEATPVDGPEGGPGPPGRRRAARRHCPASVGHRSGESGAGVVIPCSAAAKACSAAQRYRTGPFLGPERPYSPLTKGGVSCGLRPGGP